MMETYRNIQDMINNEIVSKLANKIENLFIEGLKIKGFEFDNKSDLENFVKNRCRCEDYESNKQRIYYVDNTPFFLHNYEPEYNNDFTESKTITANYGTFKFL